MGNLTRKMRFVSTTNMDGDNYLNEKELFLLRC
jgi:hypothetical protein